MFANPDQDRLAQLYARHAERHGYTLLSAETLEDFLKGDGDRVLLLGEDPRLVPEAWDLAVILPEALAPRAGQLAVGLVPPSLARPLAQRYGIQVMPALLFLRSGEYVDTLAGLRDWAVYAAEIPRILAQPTRRAPGIGIPVTHNAGSTCA